MSNQIYFDAMKAKGLADAADLQERSSSLDGTALYAEEDKIPDFAEALKARNMLERKAGQKDGFVCRSSGDLSGPPTRTRRCPSSPSPRPPTPKGTAAPLVAKPGAARSTPTPGPRRQTRSFGKK